MAGTLLAAWPAAAHAANGSGTHYYLDCATGKDTNKGTSTAAPFRTLSKINTLTLKPGDSVSLLRGTTCSGVLVPRGAGTAASPITINAYGSGSRPQIVAPGVRAAVHLRNTQGYEIRSLDISNPGPATTDPRAGIYVENTDYGKGEHYVVDDTSIHDVLGCDCTNPGQPSGGVVFNALGSAKLTSFSDIKVTRNTVRHVDGIGIGASSLWARRPVYPDGPGSGFGPIAGMRVEGNSLSDLGGDGINITNGVNALVQNNVVSGFGLRATTDHAGIWAWNSDYTTVQYNEVGGGNAGSYGAFAFDVDGGNTGTVYQYNYTHDNSGFMLLCSIPGLVSVDQTVRFNISQNDRDVSGGVITLACTRQTDIKVYHNTFYAPNTSVMVKNYSDNAVAFTDNIFQGKPGAGQFLDTYGVYRSNLYHNVTGAPADPAAVTGLPKFVAPGAATNRLTAAAYALRTGSPALGSGAVVANNGGKDYFGLPVPATKPNIGAYQGPGVPVNAG